LTADRGRRSDERKNCWKKLQEKGERWLSRGVSPDGRTKNISCRKPWRPTLHDPCKGLVFSDGARGATRGAGRNFPFSEQVGCSHVFGL
jgi:hypothetical protein